jgi:hypothetical protein
LGTEEPSRSRRSRAQRSNRTLVAWTIFFSLIAICTIGTVIIYFYNWGNKTQSGENFGTSAAPDFEGAFGDIKSRQLPSLDSDSAKKIVWKSLEISDPSLEENHFIIHSAQVSVVSALAELTESEGQISQIEWIGQMFRNGRVHDEVVVFRKYKGKTSNRLAQVFKGEDGKWRIDFDSYMRTSTPAWEEILSRSTDTSIVRVFISGYSYYNSIYSDDRIWQSYSIVSPDVPEIIYGYAKRGSRQDIALSKIIESGGNTPRVTLGLLSEDNAGERQFEISRVYTEDWALAPEAYDESF